MSVTKTVTIVNQDTSCCQKNQQSFGNGVIYRGMDIIKIAIVHHDCAIAGLRAMSSAWDTIQCIGEHNDVEACLNHWKAKALSDWPEVFSVSTKLKSWDMRAVVKELKSYHSALNILMMHEYEDDNIQGWFDCGAKGYVNLRANAFEIKCAIETIATSDYYFVRPANTLWSNYADLATLKKALKALQL